MLRLERVVFAQLISQTIPGRVLILLGARRVGKTSLLKELATSFDSELVLSLNGEDQATLDRLSIKSVVNYRAMLGKVKYLIIDEAQNIPEIGLKLKLIVDELPEVAIIVTGSSMFELTNQLGEPLVGRSLVIQLFPLAQLEFNAYENLIETDARLQQRMVLGSYPELVHLTTEEDKIDYLEGIVNSYLLKDILAFQGIKKSDKIMDLLRLVAFQVGSEVSIDELASNLKGISRNTIETYLELLAKVFVIYPVQGFSRNLRKEIRKSNRWYFYDNGIRNALIRNYNALNLRNDTGQLWENYLMAERMKVNAYLKRRVNTYFWRTYDQQEIDLVEESGSSLVAYEFKWNKTKVKVPSAWKNTYADAKFVLVNQENYLDFITGNI
jgi:predicted AAA+ superfamily ATPase